MQSMKNRVLRVPDELWDAAQAKAQQEGATLSAVIRRLLTAWLKATVVVLAAVFALSACGSDEPSARDQVVAEQSVAEQEAIDVEARALAGECFSFKYEPTSSEYLALERDLVTGTDAERLDAYVRMLDWLPEPAEGCEPRDVRLLEERISAAETMIDALGSDD